MPTPAQTLPPRHDALPRFRVLAGNGAVSAHSAWARPPASAPGAANDARWNEPASPPPESGSAPPRRVAWGVALAFWALCALVLAALSYAWRLLLLQ